MDVTHARTSTWFAVAALAIGTGLLLTAGLAAPSAESKTGVAGSSTLKKGGILRVNLAGNDVDAVDPSIAYGCVLEDRILDRPQALKLPGRAGSARVAHRADGASRYTVSNRGRTYTFFVRPGFRFNGDKVTARNYAYALNRSLGRELQSPGFQFISDRTGTNIVGSQSVRNGQAQSASGIRVRATA